MFVTPEYVFKDVTHITPEWLAAKGIRALVLDIDNTLTADRSQDLPDEVAGWLAQMKATARKSGCAPLPGSWGWPTSTARPSPCLLP